MSIGLVGKKSGMSRLFQEDGTSVPVTIVSVAANFVAEIKLTFMNNKKGPGVRLTKLLFPSSRTDVSVIPINSVVIAINNVPTTEHVSAINQFDALSQMGRVINFTIIK